MPLPAAFPTALDALANPTATTNRDDAGFELDEVVSRIHDILEALEAKVGIGASLPSSAGVLRETAPGTTAWGQVVGADIAAGTILTANILLGEVSVVSSVVGSTSNPTATASPTTVPEMSLSPSVTTGDRLLILFDTNFFVSAANAGATFQLYYDSTLLKQRIWTPSVNTNTFHIALSTIYTVPSTGTHTISAAFSVNSGTVTCSSTLRELAILQVKR